jgi:haloacetate dehalogenase
MERRKFLGALTAASLGMLLERSLTELAHAQSTAVGGTSLADQAPFKTSEVEVSGNTIFVRRYGQGPAILMVHGFPRTSLMWRDLAPKLAENHTVICVDLRAYGGSGTPASAQDTFLIQNAPWQRNWLR